MANDAAIFEFAWEVLCKVCLALSELEEAISSLKIACLVVCCSILCVCCTSSLSICADVRLAVKAIPTSLTVGVTT